MNTTSTVILIVILVPLVIFAVWQFLQLALVHIESGTLGLLIVRGKATSRTLPPGTHFVLPFRQTMIQVYPLRDLTYLTSAHPVEDTDYADRPFTASMGDRTTVEVFYTIRFRIRSEGLTSIHERFGPDGIKPFVRDLSRQVIADELADASHGVEDTFGEGFAQVETTIGTRIATTLQDAGFELLMFHLRDLDIGALGEVITRTVRAKLELDHERAMAQVRALRIEHESASNAGLANELTDEVLRYRRIELGRDALARWDGRLVVGEALARGLADEPPSPSPDSAVAEPPAAAE
jgi:regulator of protease activity HflC (stomatin/prohibitin superfamily)